MEGPSFGGLKPQNRGETGSRYVIYDLYILIYIHVPFQLYHCCILRSSNLVYIYIYILFFTYIHIYIYIYISKSKFIQTNQMTVFFFDNLLTFTFQVGTPSPTLLSPSRTLLELYVVLFEAVVC